jgi:hypothetical protein
MLRLLLVFLITFSFCSQQALAFSVISDSTKSIITETWDAQSFEQLENGVVAVPAQAINDYLVTVLPDYPDVKSVNVTIHPNNSVDLDINTQKTGRVFLQGTITRFVQNKDESTVSIMLTKHKLLDRPVASWFFSHMSLGMMTKLFGNPLKGNEANFTSKFDGNQLTINFKPYIDKSPMSTANVMDMPLTSLINIDSLTTDEGVVYLHTSLQGSQSIYSLIHRILNYGS